MDKTSSCSSGQKCSRPKVSVACQTDDDSTTGVCDHSNSDVAGKSTASPKAPSSNEPTTSTQSQSSSGVSSRSTEDGLLRVTIQNFSKMSDTLCSPTKRIKEVPWRIMVMPKQHMVQKKSQKCMGFFLQCCPDNVYNDTWSCQAIAEMRLISQKTGVSNFIRKTTHVYTAKENDWGYSCFMTWADVLDENQGYIKDDKVVLEIYVKSDAPKNLMSRDEFVQALDQWYRLADMQYQRGNIDLAIEANGQAIAYCKDKDKESMDRLKAQKEVLVKEKLVQSIKRLESGGTALLPNKEETNTNEKISVRAAINGTTPKAPTTPLMKRPTDKPHNVVKKVQKGTFPPKTNNGIKKADVPVREQAKKEALKNAPTVSDAESDDHDAEEYGDDLDVSIDTIDTMDLFLPVSKEMKNSEYVKKYGFDRVFKGSQSSLEETSEKVETNDSGCQTEQSLLSLPVGNARVTSQPQQVAVGTTATRVGIQIKSSPPSAPVTVSTTPATVIAAPMSSPSRIPPPKLELELSVNDQNSDQLRNMVAFFDEKNSMDIVKQLAQIQHNVPESAQVGAQECVAVVIAAHIASINCNKVVKEMDGFLREAESLFQGESFLSVLTQLRNSVASGSVEPATPPITDNTTNPKSDVSSRPVVGLSTTQSVSSSDGSETDSYSGDCSDGEDEESVTTPEELDEVLDGILTRSEFKPFRRHCKTEATETVRSLAARELFTFNNSMTRAMDRVHQLAEGVDALQRSLSGADITKLATAQCAKYADAEARNRTLEAALSKEKTAHQATNKLLTEAQVHLADVRTRNEHIAKQLKDKTNEMKKLEKKSSRDDHKIAELIGEKTEMEDRLKTMKREMDAIKKKNAEESKKVKREREKETEKIKKMEQEFIQRMAEKEKETKSMEDRARLLQSEVDTQKREMRGLEAREKKNAAWATQQIAQANEKVKQAEASVLEMRLLGVCAVWDKVKEDSEKEVSELEELMKKCRLNNSTEADAVERSLMDWKAYKDCATRTAISIKAEYLPQIESVRKGEKQASQVQIKASEPGPWPSIIRPSCVAPVSLPGVIGQPRTPQPVHSQQNGYVNGSSPGNSNNQYSRAPSPPVEKDRIAPIGSDYGAARPMATVAPQTMDSLDGDSAGGCSSGSQWGWNPLGLGLSLQPEPTGHRNLYSDPPPQQHWDRPLGQSIHQTTMQGYPSWSAAHGGTQGPLSHQSVQSHQAVQQHHQHQLQQHPQSTPQHQQQMSAPPPLGTQPPGTWSPGWPHHPPSHQAQGYQPSPRQVHKFI